MPRIPSVKTIQNGLRITKEQAQTIRTACESNRGLNAANKILDGHGVEVIGLPDGCFDNCQAPDVTIRYVNRGDTYDTTLLKVNGSYRVGSWGDVVERYQGMA